jgi:hypothetical protein
MVLSLRRIPLLYLPLLLLLLLLLLLPYCIPCLHAYSCNGGNSTLVPPLPPGKTRPDRRRESCPPYPRTHWSLTPPVTYTCIHACYMHACVSTSRRWWWHARRYKGVKRGGEIRGLVQDDLRQVVRCEQSPVEASRSWINSAEGFNVRGSERSRARALRQSDRHWVANVQHARAVCFVIVCCAHGRGRVVSKKVDSCLV